MRDHSLQVELRRILKPDGLIYFERRGLPEQLRGGGAVRRLAEAFGASRLYWLTPLGGEMHTAVPVRDQATIRYFLRHGLTSRSLDLGVLKRVVRSIGGRSAGPAALKPAAPKLSSNSRPRAGFQTRIAHGAGHAIAAGASCAR